MLEDVPPEFVCELSERSGNRPVDKNSEKLDRHVNLLCPNFL
jgi:hypothetical protein